MKRCYNQKNNIYAGLLVSSDASIYLTDLIRYIYLPIWEEFRSSIYIILRRVPTVCMTTCLPDMILEKCLV